MSGCGKALLSASGVPLDPCKTTGHDGYQEHSDECHHQPSPELCVPRLLLGAPFLLGGQCLGVVQLALANRLLFSLDALRG